MAKPRQAKTTTRRAEDAEAEVRTGALQAAFELLEQLPVPMFLKSRDGRYLGVNRAWEELFGLERASFLGKEVRDLYPQHPEIAEKHALKDRELYERPGTQSYEIPIVTPDGRRRDTIYYKATFPPGGRPQGLVGAIFDVTARKAAEAAVRDSEERWRATIDSASEGMLIYDRALNIVSANRAAERILRVPAAELIGKPGFTSLLAVIDEHGKPLGQDDRPTRITVRTGAPQTGRVVGIRRADGSVTWLSVNTAFLRRLDETDYYGLVSTVSDITAQHDAEARLKESEARFRRTFELAGSGMAHIGMDRRFIRVNRRLCEILGYEEQELLGLTGRQISHPDDLDIINEQRPRLYAGEIDAVRVEKRYLRKDGSVVWVHFSMTVERDAAGEPLYEIAVYEDITAQLDAQLRLRESEARYRQTFELAASGICHVRDGRFIQVNRRLCEILGYPEPELLGKHVKEISHPEDRDVTDAERARIRSREIDSARFEKRYLRADGAVVWCRIAITLVRDVYGVPQYEVAIFDDITDRKKAEAALHEAHEELKRSNAELEQFAYVASHDLQEPLRMVASYTQLLARRYDERLDKDAREFMAYIVDGAARMKQLIEDLLAYSRVGTKGVAFKRVSAEAALRRALFNLRAAIEEAGALVTHDPMPTLPADEVQLAQLFQNLIGNALKFRSQAVPKVHVAVTESPVEYAFEIRDNGIGIEPQYYGRIFMLFQRLHNKGEYPGTGIGLAICKKVAERHGGRIWVESRPAQGPSQGSSFFFTLPKERRSG
ncbi:MAG TPA: PAS domain S-box protein [Burkholderiales bacterium]|nr:PAS domain S-box protein [Burkholderiales bacterium]